MIYLVASLTLLALFPFVVWPLLSPSQARRAAEDEQDAESERTASLAAIEEVELDIASGRLSPEEGEQRLAEARAQAHVALVSGDRSAPGRER